MGIAGRPQLRSDRSEEDRVIRRAFNRLVSFLFILYFISFLDRINIGFAALSMNKELGLTANEQVLTRTTHSTVRAACTLPYGVGIDQSATCSDRLAPCCHSCLFAASLFVANH